MLRVNESNETSNVKVPVTGGFYRHFKGNVYQVKGVARHSDNLKYFVVY
ncbi:MAG: DUF1653 domain-containing protein, partial [Lachnospiraceae bacterium]|nr:DUF1653 domain-containing protein [Lachnospiraceae bacterium]